MINNYMAPEVIEIGEAKDVILGTKLMFDMDYDGQSIDPDSNLDD